MISLATAFLYLQCSEDLRANWYTSFDSDVVRNHVHLTSEGFKVYLNGLWLMLYRKGEMNVVERVTNVIVPLRTDLDVMLTFEGANGIMLHHVCEQLLAECSIAAEKRTVCKWFTILGA